MLAALFEFFEFFSLIVKRLLKSQLNILFHIKISHDFSGDNIYV